jgi:uncharacterized GH25 family protein
VAIVAALAWWLLAERGASGGERGAASSNASSQATAPVAAPLPEGSPADARCRSSRPTRRPSRRQPTWLARARARPWTSRSCTTPTARAVPDVELAVVGTLTDVEPQRVAHRAAHTAADGTARVEFDHAVRVWLVRALPGDRHALVELRPEPELDIALGASERIELRAKRGAVVRGQVVDEAGTPVPQATVLAWCDMRWNLENGDDSVPPPDARTVCDNAGRFELGGLGPQLVLMPQAPGLAPRSGVAGPIPEGADVGDLALVLGAAHELRGRVVDPDGRPVAGLRVKAGHSSMTPIQAGLDLCPPLKRLQTTDADGRFTLAPLAATSWAVTVHAPGFQPWSRVVKPDVGELLVQLSTGLALSGLVLGADGAPLDGAQVLLGGASQDEFEGDTQTTQTVSGRFRFEALLPTEHATLGVSAAGHALFVLEGVVVDEPDAPPLELRLEPERPIAGRVVDEHDEPVPGAEVTVRGDRRVAPAGRSSLAWEDWFWPRVSWTQTDAEGRFRLERLYDGLFELAVEDPRHEGLRHTESLRSGTEDVLVRLDPDALRGAVLTGRVSDALSGAPLDDFLLWLEPLDPGRRVAGTHIPFQRFEHAQGAFRLEGIEPGRWRPTADSEGYARTSGPELELREGEQSVELAIRPARTLRLRVIDQDGAPVRGVFVSFEDSRGERIDLQAQPVGDGTIGMSDKIGELTAHGLPADLVTVVLRVPLVPGTDVATRRERFPLDLRTQPEGVQELRIERKRARCLVVSLLEGDVEAAGTVYDGDAGDTPELKALQPLLEQGRLVSVSRPIVVTVTAADGTLVDTARCEPSGHDPQAWRVSSSVCSSEGEPASWLAVALPAGASRATIVAEGHEPVTLELPAGDEHVRRMVVLRQTTGP